MQVVRTGLEAPERVDYARCRTCDVSRRKAIAPIAPARSPGATTAERVFATGTAKRCAGVLSVIRVSAAIPTADAARFLAAV